MSTVDKGFVADTIPSAPDPSDHDVSDSVGGICDNQLFIVEPVEEDKGATLTMGEQTQQGVMVEAELYDLVEVCSDNSYLTGGKLQYEDTNANDMPTDSVENLVETDPPMVGATQHGEGTDTYHTGTDEQRAFDIRLANTILESGVFNFQGLQLPVQSRWNTELLDNLLQEYPDKEIISFLQYGWPIDRDPELPIPDCGDLNHKGAVLYPQYVDQFIAEELECGTLSGPHDELPGYATSPINTRAKRNSNSRRHLMDLSWPQDGTSINAGVDKDWFLGREMRLQYPTVWDFIRQIGNLKKQGQPRMFKRDLFRAFYQLPLCPSCYRFTGFKWRGKKYFFKFMPMGLTSACRAMQRTTNAIKFMMEQMGYYLCPYIDDMVGAEVGEWADAAYLALGRLCRDIGAEESLEKAVPPTCVMEFLGNLLNTDDYTISVTPDRVMGLLAELTQWEELKFTTRRQLESIIGKLQFICNCVQSGRLFLNRLLNLLRGMQVGKTYRIPSQAYKDIIWWRHTLLQAKYTAPMWHKATGPPDSVMAGDSSLQAAGGVCGNEFFRVKFPEHITGGASIAILELWALILCLKIWGHKFQGCSVWAYCDNQAVAELIGTGRARNLRLQEGLWEVCYLTAIYGFELQVLHLPGCENRLPDFLSRWWQPGSYRAEFRRLAPNMNRKPVHQSLFYYSHDW